MKMLTRTLTLFGASLFGLVAIQAAVDAKPLRKNETYCLEAHTAGGSGGGNSHMECRYETRAQCMASKTSPSDICSLNPALAAKRQGR